MEQIIDSTPMLGAAATQDTVRLVRHGVRKLIDGWGRGMRGAGEGLDRGLGSLTTRGRPRSLTVAGASRAERERMLTRVAEDAERALQRVEHADGLLGDERVGDAHRLCAS